MNFENVRMEIVAFEAEDVVTTSNPTIVLPEDEF